MILLPLPRSRWQRPLFGWHKCAVDTAKSIWPRAYKSSARTFRIWTNTDPGLEVSVTGRAGWISTRDVSPSRASAHDPQNAVHHLARVATWPTSAVSTTRRDRDKRFDQAPLCIR